MSRRLGSVGPGASPAAGTGGSSICSSIATRSRISARAVLAIVASPRRSRSDSIRDSVWISSMVTLADLGSVRSMLPIIQAISASARENPEKSPDFLGLCLQSIRYVIYSGQMNDRNTNTEHAMTATIGQAIEAINLEAARAYRMNPLTRADILATQSCGGLADALAARIPGAVVERSQTTESAYISWPGARSDIRLSCHSSFGANRPTHVQMTSAVRLVDRLDRAVRAAASGARSYSQVPTWDQISE